MVQATKCVQEQNLGRYKGVLKADLARGGGAESPQNEQTNKRTGMHALFSNGSLNSLI